MNRETLDFLTAGEKTDIVSDIGDYMDDTHVSTALTYKDFISKVRTPSTGAFTATYTSYAGLRGSRSDVSAREVQISGGLLQLGDVAFLIAQSDLAITPAREDQLAVGSETYEVIKWAGDPVGMLWRIVARKVKAP